MADMDKIVVVTRKTALEELIERYNTRDQARFYLEHMGASFDSYQSAHDAYAHSLDVLKSSLPRGVRSQFIDRSFLPNFLFGEHDLVVTLGPDGLVVNTAKYLSEQPLVALNPDPERIDGILLPITMDRAPQILEQSVRGRYGCMEITMARVDLNNGQRLYALNDLFIGQRTHLSARYRLRLGDRAEDQSSSGIIVSTGAGSTGWFRSILTGAAGVVEAFAATDDVRATRDKYRFDWDADYLYFSVREPFVSRVSSAELVFGKIDQDERLEVVSQMPQNGVIFSDGIEDDYLPFTSGSIAQIGLAEKKLHLVME